MAAIQSLLPPFRRITSPTATIDPLDDPVLAPQHPGAYLRGVISPSHPVGPAEVARHYDELDDGYRGLWGDHLHHGLWDNEDDRRSVAEATTRLLEELTPHLALRRGRHLADIGCGYGASARWLANRHGLQVTALTLSPRQLAHAREATPPEHGRVEYRLEDWVRNSLPDRSLDGALAVEVLAHVARKDQFFKQLARTLKPAATCVLAVWTVPDDLRSVERLLLRHLCREGRLAGIGRLEDYTGLATTAGLRIVHTEDLTPRVTRTWSVLTRRALAATLTRPHHLRHLLRRPLSPLTFPAMLLAYHTGALRYRLMVVQRPEEEPP